MARQRIIHWSDRQSDTEPIYNAAELILRISPFLNDPVHRRLFSACYSAAGVLADFRIRTDREPQCNLGLAALLFLRRGAACTYPSDQVYSLLGAAGRDANILVDYSKSFADIYTRTTYLIIQRENSLGVLCMVQKPQIDGELPSWVPDFRIKLESSRSISITIPIADRKYAATGSSNVRAKLSADSKALQVSGIRFAHIQDAKSCLSTDALAWIDSHLGSGTDGLKRYAYTNETAFGVWMRTVLRDTWGTGADKSDDGSRLNFNTRNLIRKVIAARHDGQRGTAVFEAYSRLIAFSALRKTFFGSEKGHIGLAGDIAQVGDEIVFLCGAEVPFLLRRSEEDPETYRFVAECYVHGFMDGEAFVEARQAANLGEELTDTSWLDTIGDGELPFPLTEFSII